MIGSSDSNRSERQGGFREELSTKEGESKGHDRRNTNRQRGRVWAISVLGNAKSNRHRKTHQVEPDGPEPKMFMHLTRGDLRRENGGEVSRGRSSEEVPVMGMERRAKESRSLNQPRLIGSEKYFETSGRGNCGRHPLAGKEQTEWIL